MMTKKRAAHQHSQSSLQIFAKDLVRRSRSKCELCQKADRLFVYEVPPVPAEPDFEKCIFICQGCLRQIEKPKELDPRYWKCLRETIWSEVPAIQIMAGRMLKRLSALAPWASEVLEEVYLEEEILEAINEVD
ncbi:MAG: phnA protein [Verrucomicrobiota bacterium]